MVTDEKLKQLAQVVAGYQIVERAIRQALKDKLTMTCQLRVKIEAGNVAEVHPHTGQSVRRPASIEEARQILAGSGWLVHDDA